MPKRDGRPLNAERCVEVMRQGRCWGFKLKGSDRCPLHERRVTATTPIAVIEPEVERDGDLRLYQDPLYRQRVEHWLANPKALLDWRHTMARTQALADMLEDRVRRAGPGGTVPPPLLYAIDELRKMHLAIARLEAAADETKYIHVDIVDALVGNMVSVLTEFVSAERVPAALDKLQSLQEAVIPGTRYAKADATPKPAANGAAAAESDVEPEDTMEPDW
jgi:hypothetical protein